MGMEKRITVEEVKAAFEKTKLKPKQGFYFQRETSADTSPKCACGMGVLYLAQTEMDFDEAAQLDDEGSDINLYFTERYGADYRVGFAHGFDSGHRHSSLAHSPEYQQGYEDGDAARAAMGLPERGVDE